MPVVSRWTMVYALYAYPYARPQGLGGEIRKTITRWRFISATIITLLIVVAAAWLGGISYCLAAGLALMAGTWVIITLAAGYFKKMFAGLTGDTYGAINEIAEVCVLLIMVLLTYNRWLI
jgi:adenosylcobinamide-GDP ribazoletransferase